MLKRRNMKKMLGIGSLCLFLLGCSEESFLVQKDSSSIILEDEITFSEEELQVLPKDVGEQAKEILAKREEDTAEPKLTEDVSAEIAVHICGAVNQPGVYYLNENQRLYEGIQKAGGFRQDAEENYLNQAMVLEDGMKIIVPTKEEVNLEENLKTESQRMKDKETENKGDTGNSSDSYILSQNTTEELAAESGYLQKKDRKQNADEADVSEKQNGKVNLNTADETLLCTLPGIGESRAKSIIAYRQEHGLFQKTEDVMKVSGIKQAAYEKMKDYVTVSD